MAVSKVIEKEITFNRKTTYVKVDKLTRTQRVTAKIKTDEVQIIIRNPDGTLKIEVPHVNRKIELKALIKKIVDTGELKKNTAKSRGFRKTICDILRSVCLLK